MVVLALGLLRELIDGNLERNPLKFLGFMILIVREI
jgi:hypothetical protein